MVLEKHLSKHLDSLYEENEQYTIDHDDHRRSHHEKSPIKLVMVEDDENDEDDPLRSRVQPSLYI